MPSQPDLKQPTRATLLRPLSLALVAVTVVLVGIAVVSHYVELLSSASLTGHQGDYGIFAEMGRTIVNGRRLYVDFWSGMAPGVPLLLVPYIAVLGPTVLAVNLEAVTIFIVFGLASGALAYSLTGSRAGALAASLAAFLYTTYQSGPETVFTMATFGTVAIWLAVQGRGRAGWMFAAGAVFAFGILAKQPLLFEIPILFLVVVWKTPARQRLKALVFVALGGLLVAATVILWTLSQGILEAMVFRTITIMSQYVTGGDSSWHFSEQGRELFEHYFLRSTLVYLRPLLVAAALASIPVLLTRRSRRTLAFLAFWFVWSFIIAAIPRGWRADYFAQVLPALIAIVAVGVSQVARMNTWKQAAATAIALTLIVGYNLLFVRPINGSIRADMPEENRVLDVIATHTQPDDCLWMWGSMAYFNYLSQRDSCAGAAIEGFTMDSSTFPIVPLRIEYMQQLFQRMPALHVNQNTWGYFPQLQDFADRYLDELVLETERYRVLTLDHSMWHEADANFGDEIRFIGYDLLPVNGPYCPGDTLTLAMTWQQIRTPAHQYQMFVQLLTPDEQARVAGYDGPPEDDDDDNATNTWVDTGEIRLGERFDMTIDADAEPDDYKLVVGLYDVVTAERVPVLDATGATIGSYAVFTNLTLDSACQDG